MDCISKGREEEDRKLVNTDVNNGGFKRLKLGKVPDRFVRPQEHTMYFGKHFT